MTDLLPDRFGRIPLPPRIAVLQRDDQHHYPIPFVAEWDGETTILPPPVHPRYGYVISLANVRTGQPRLGLMNPDRQRLCMTASVCQVCAKSLRKGRKFMAGGQGLEWFNEPPTCFECMRFAVQVCPGLVRGRRNIPDHRLRVLEVQSMELRQQRVGVEANISYPHPIDYYDLETFVYFIQARPTQCIDWDANDWLEATTP